MADNKELKKSGGDSRNRYEGLGWWVIGVLFIIPGAQPLGLLMLLIKLWSGGKKDPKKLTASEQRQIQEAARKYTPVDRPVIDVEPAEAVSRKYAPYGEYRRSRQGETAAKPRSAAKSVPPEKKAPAVREAARSLTRTPRTSSRKAKLLKVVGVVAMALGAIGLSETVGDFLWAREPGILWEVAQAAMVALAGGVALFSGFRMAKRQRRNEQYLSLMGQKDTVAFDQLSRMMGLPPYQVTRDLRDMWDRGDLPEGAFLDLEQGRYFASFQAAEALAASRRAEEAAPPRQSEEGWSGILRGIRRANDAIADPALSARIDRITDLAGRILRLAEEEPEKENQVRGFLDYYLPTTRKLLDAYASFEHAGLDSENLTASKARITAAVEKLEEGYRHQLDALYRADTLDIETEIRVMETMLQRDLGSVEKDFKL